MKITITKTEEEFDITAAWRILAQMLEKPKAGNRPLNRTNHHGHAQYSI